MIRHENTKTRNSRRFVLVISCFRGRNRPDKKTGGRVAPGRRSSITQITRLRDYQITQLPDLEIELESKLEHARGDDLLHASEVRSAFSRCVERRLIGETARHR